MDDHSSVTSKPLMFIYFFVITNMEFLILLLSSICFLIFFYQVYQFYVGRCNSCCYLVHYECHKPSDDRKIDTRFCGKIIARNKNLGLEDCKFLLHVITSSGIGEETYGPRNIIAGRETSPTLEDAILELDEFLVDTLDQLFKNTGVSPQEIDVLVVNVALLATVPSLTSRIINHYKMRKDVKSFNLSGMGCSASLVSINLVENIFKSYKDAFAIVVTSESIAPNWYSGNKKSMLLSNCLFRSGGCSILLTNKSTYKNRAKLRLKCLVRTHLGASDEAYNSVIRKEDNQGRIGMHLGRNLPNAATRALTMNITSLAIKILPLKEIVRYAILKIWRGTANLNLNAGIDYFCVHPGGSAVIEEIRKGLGLCDHDVEPSKMTLHRFGNTSASGLWYVLSYLEAKKKLKKGKKVWMIGFGSGLKCISCVWEVLRDLEDGNVWGDEIVGYPPQTTANPYMEQFGWINEGTLLEIPEDIRRALL